MHKLIMGVLALAAGLALIALSVANGSENALAGGLSPTATPDPTLTPQPTFDPCDDFKQPPATCTAPTQPPRNESTNTPTKTATPEGGATEPPSTPPPASTTAPPPPAASATPAGGAGAGGVAPPDTGSGTGTGGGTGLSWMMIAGGLLAAAGAGTLVYGARRGR